MKLIKHIPPETFIASLYCWQQKYMRKFFCHTIKPLLNSIIFAFIYTKFLFSGLETHTESEGSRAGLRAPRWESRVTGLHTISGPRIDASETKLLSGRRCWQTMLKMRVRQPLLNSEPGTPKVA